MELLSSPLAQFYFYGNTKGEIILTTTFYFGLLRKSGEEGKKTFKGRIENLLLFITRPLSNSMVFIK
jgi:hypothetical protein